MSLKKGRLLHSKAVQFMMESGKGKFVKVLGHKSGLMGLNMKANGKITKQKARENFGMLMEIFMMVSLNKKFNFSVGVFKIRFAFGRFCFICLLTNYLKIFISMSVFFKI